MSSRKQIKIINDEFRRIILLKYKHLTFNFEYNLFVDNLEAFTLCFPKEIVDKIYNKEHFFCLYVCDEAQYKYVDLLYDTLIIECGVPESQVVIACSSPDYKQYIIDAAKKRNKQPIHAEYISVFEHQQKQLFLWYVQGNDTFDIQNQILPYKSSLHNLTFTKKYLNFNRRWKEHRFAIISLLHSNNLIVDGYNSFSNCPVNSDDLYFNNNNSFDLMFNDTLNKYDNIKDKLAAGYNVKDLLPLIIDSQFFQTYFAFDTSHRPLKKYFNSTYFSLVNETYFETGNVRFLTEKIYKPIMHKHPFILVSTPYSLELLKEQGYKTFDDFIDESYDNELDNGKRLLKIIKEVEKLCKLNQSELKVFQNYCLPIVEHNYKIFFEKQIEVIKLI